jgi:hypothetical protein
MSVQTEQEKPPFIKSVIFDLPFVLFLADNFKDKQLEDWLEARQKGEPPPYSRYVPCPNKPSHVVLGGGLPIYLPPENVAKMYFVRLPNLECGMRFLKRVNPHREVILAGEVPGDRTGRASFSTVEVRFDPRFVPHSPEQENQSNIPPPSFYFGSGSTPINDGLRVWVSYALDAINHFIEHYRVISNRPWVNPVTEAIIQQFFIITETLDGEITTQTYMGSTGPMHGFGGSIPEEQDQQLRQKVSQSNPPDVRATIYQEILSHHELGRYRLAVIETAVLFESWITGMLTKYLSNKGYDETQINEVLNRNDSRPHEVEHLAKVVIRQQTGFSFNETREFQLWKEDVLGLRNDVVHGRKFEVNKEQALNAFEIVNNAVRLISENVFSQTSSVD